MKSTNNNNSNSFFKSLDREATHHHPLATGEAAIAPEKLLLDIPHIQLEPLPEIKFDFEPIRLASITGASFICRPSGRRETTLSS